MKRKLTHSLVEIQKVHKDLYEVFTTDFWNNGTHTMRELSHHATEREAQEQKLINKHKNENK